MAILQILLLVSILSLSISFLVLFQSRSLKPFPRFVVPNSKAYMISGDGILETGK